MSTTHPDGSRKPALPVDAIIWDNHGCMPLRAAADFLPQLERYRNSGVNVISLNIGMADVSLLDHLRVVSYMRRWVSLHPDKYRLVGTAQDVRNCKLDGTLGIVFDVEGMGPVQDDVSFIQTFYELGVRWMLIAYNRNNRAGGGCLDEDSGLTDIGRSVIDEMERVGMVLCLSHAGARTAAEALDYGRNPAIFSHSNPYSCSAHVRNISDGLMRKCAQKGGVVGLSGVGIFLGATENLVGNLLRQLRYVVDLIGAEHVGLGLDYVFDREELNEFVRLNPGNFPELGVNGEMKFVEPEAIGEIAEGLAKMNFTDSQIKGILGGNWLRLAERIWR